MEISQGNILELEKENINPTNINITPIKHNNKPFLAKRAFSNLKNTKSIQKNKTEPFSVIKDKQKKFSNKKVLHNTDLDLLFYEATHIEKTRDCDGKIIKESIEKLNKDYIENNLKKNYKS